MTFRRVTNTAGGKEIYVNKNKPTDSRPLGTRALRPGSYVLDVRHAIERLAGGRVVGVCRVCAREFRIPLDFAEWEEFLHTMIRHPLEHNPNRAMEEQASQGLEEIDSISPEWAQNTLAEVIADYLEGLDTNGILVRIHNKS
jgi:hypothetical protein